ncbi:hypothetical protein CYY_008181 [Polysphondylium violaceum]|uniref:GRAM domain-containing protein n=1 Tax=Polysphondylium violaceum TaxID=133409 RepID=A0A8J4UXH7_9MYCE|nr:hypothetical protein CYY_008181 [Polysphondylium violaceum]
MQSEIDQLIHQIESLTRDKDLLNQDRRELYQQCLHLKEENLQLKLANIKYKEFIQSYDKDFQEIIVAPVDIPHECNISESDKDHKQQQQQHQQHNHKLRLPEGETSMKSYSCTYDIHTGSLNISQNYIYFVPHIGVIASTLHIGDDQSIVIPIRDIVSLNKTKNLKFVQCVELTVQDNQVKIFKNFIKRKECLRSIFQQAILIGHSIQTLRENSPDLDSYQ